jgi:nitroreductase
VEEEKLNQILEAVRQAPSWANQQCWKFVIVKEAKIKERLSRLSYVESFFAKAGYKSNPASKGIAEAPLNIVACADPQKSGSLWGQPFYMTDVGIATQNLMLAARALGLGTVYVGVFNENKIKELLKIPPHIRIVGIFPIGYPRQEKKVGPPRKPLGEIIFYEEWQALIPTHIKNLNKQE